MAAFAECDGWKNALLDYLRGNRSAVAAAIQQMPPFSTAPVEATYLAWINVADLGLSDTENYFAEHGLGISPGAQFGAPEYIRFNFGCPRAILQEGLARLTAAIEAAS